MEEDWITRGRDSGRLLHGIYTHVYTAITLAESLNAMRAPPYVQTRACVYAHPRLYILRSLSLFHCIINALRPLSWGACERARDRERE